MLFFFYQMILWILQNFNKNCTFKKLIQIILEKFWKREVTRITKQLLQKKAIGENCSQTIKAR